MILRYFELETTMLIAMLQEWEAMLVCAAHNHIGRIRILY
jgi:hypothetical protein